MKGKFEYSDFENFYNDLVRFTDDFEEWLHTFLYSEWKIFEREVKLRTPVLSGDLQGSWTLEGISKDGDVLHCHFYNPVHYASYVEYGHAFPYKSGMGPTSAYWVDGYYMMTVSLIYINESMPARLKTQYDIFEKGWA